MEKQGRFGIGKQEGSQRVNDKKDKKETLEHAARVLSYELNRDIKPEDIEGFYVDGMESFDLVSIYLGEVEKYERSNYGYLCHCRNRYF